MSGTQGFGRGLLRCATVVLALVGSPAGVAAQWTANGSNINNTNSGNVGVGTTSPATKLQIAAPAGSEDATRISQELPSATQPNYTELAQRSWSASHALLWGAYKTPSGSSVNGSLLTTGNTRNYGGPGSNSWGPGGIIYNANGGTMHFVIGPQSPGAGESVNWGTPLLTLTRAGNVGVGTGAPGAKLHVAGNVTVDGNIAAKYQDLAEWVPSRHVMPAATVVVLDPDRSNHVMPSQQAYDTRVAGVISAQPGVLLGEGGAGQVIVATTGRVKVRVSAVDAPIRVGDLLVTSDVAGTAIRSEPIDIGGIAIHRPGTVIGKALEPLDNGIGEVLVLLSLQ